MEEKYDLTTGSVGKSLVRFALPYLFAAFLQTFYGLADLYIVGIYNDARTITAVSIGSQVMHMVTVIILGFAMGTTVRIARFAGEKNEEGISRTIKASIRFFLCFAVFMTVLLFFLSGAITKWMMTPGEAFLETRSYLKICFLGIPFITAYNVISSIFRGMGDSRHPMFFVGTACIVNIVLDFILIGGMGMGAEGAALGTVLGQTVSVLLSFLVMKKINLGAYIRREGFEKKKRKESNRELFHIFKVGAPVALQDGLIQIAFIVITTIANDRGLLDAAAVGIVEKLIGFMFLVPSAFLSAISAITAQNVGAGKKERARKSLYLGLLITMAWGGFCNIYNQFFPDTLVGAFTKEIPVLLAGCTYMRAYSLDVFFAAIHFCFSGYFCGRQKSGISFLHNIISILVIRIPGAYFASLYYPETLYPMGLAAPLGSLLSALICIGFFIQEKVKDSKELMNA